MRRVLVTDYAWDSLDVEREILAEADAEPIAATEGTEEELVSLADGAVTIMANWRKVTGRLLDAAADCQHVVRYGVGLDNIDLAHATELGIVVTNVPDYCVDEVSEHALALILALRRNIVVFAGETSSGRWGQGAGSPLHRLAGQTLGVVGAGRLARGLAKRAQGIGLSVIAFSRSSHPGTTQDGIEFADSLDDLLQRSDIVSLHVPLTDQTRHLMGAAELDRMKDSAILINTARGAVVDTEALAEAIGDGGIAGAGLDVMPSEPPDPADPLLRMDNVIVTPHVAAFSVESTAYLCNRAAVAARDLLLGKLPDNVVNPDVLAKPQLRAKGLRK